MKQNKFRKFINDIHLWLGLGAGIILFVVCLSGTVYTFRSEIEYMVNPDKYNANPYKPPQQLETLISDLQKQEKGKVTVITIPGNISKNYELGLVKKDTPGREAPGREKKKEEGAKGISKDRKEERPQRVRPSTYYVDPYSGKVMGKDGDKTSQFFMVMMRLHRWLLLEDNIGRPIVGTATLIFVLLSVSGLILWFPRKFRHWKRWFYWKPGFKIKYKARWKRINHDLHNTLGFYSLFILLIMSLTGLCWSFEWYKDGVSNIMGSEVFAGRNEKPVQIENPEGTLLPFEEILRIGAKELPYEGNIRISLPRDSASALTLYKNKTGFFALSASDKININPYTGTVVSKDIFKDKPLNVQIVSLIRALHLGDIFGTFSKIIYFIACLIGTSLPVTGIFIWINKMRKSKK
ncbi:MAG: PepSY domain-containing protein [Flavobacteriaceae bacterium]|jgi:uncharacterized iron-regulated membrane protein|nr:PepSY domain-containing protein [Flavobacteriaceae bacterium]